MGKSRLPLIGNDDKVDQQKPNLSFVAPHSAGALDSHNQDHLSDQNQRGFGNRFNLLWNVVFVHHVSLHL